MVSRTGARARLRTETRLVALGRAFWLLTAAAVLILLIPEIPATYNAVLHVCGGADCNTPQIPARGARALRDAGISLEVYATYMVAVSLITVVACYAVACTLMFRRSTDRMVLLTAFVCVLICTTNSLPLRAPGGSWTPAEAVISVLAAVVSSIYVYVFPSGTFVPRWSAILAAGLIALQYLPAWVLPGPLAPLLFVTFLASVIALQVYRYRRVSTAVQRQQTKLVVYTFALAFSVMILAVILSSAAPEIQYQPAVALAFGAIGPAVNLAIILSVGLAVMRYRLWDVDALINRTLVYLTLTASLGALYLGSVVLFQTIFRSVVGQHSDLAVAASTLAIAALFNPLRRRIQALIARAFYRRRYDAANVLAAFGAHCRDETDLDALRRGLLQVVDGTIGPAHVSLWLPDRA